MFEVIYVSTTYQWFKSERANELYKHYLLQQYMQKRFWLFTVYLLSAYTENSHILNQDHELDW